jgi:hypothetical protein
VVTLTCTFGRLTTALSSLTFRRALDERGRRHAPRLPWLFLLLRPMAAAAVLHLFPSSAPLLLLFSPPPACRVARRGARPGRRRRASRHDRRLGRACPDHHAVARAGATAGSGELAPATTPSRVGAGSSAPAAAAAGSAAQGSSPLAAASASVGTTTSSSTGAPRESTSPHRAQRRGGGG